MNWQDSVHLFANPNDRWLLLTGSYLGASNGVPLPFLPTAWSPSIVDLVRYEVFRTQSRETAQSVVKALGSGKPPLGFIADKLEDQVTWFRNYTDELTPQHSIVRLADLVKGGMFQGIVSNTPDDLLEKALTDADVPYQILTQEEPITPEGVLPFVKEWDDLIFQDKEAHRAQEAAFVKQRLAALSEQIDSILIMGQHYYASDLMKAIQDLCQRRPELKVVWVEEIIHQSGTAYQRPHQASTLSWLQEKHINFNLVQLEDPAPLLEAILQRRGLPLSPLKEDQKRTKGGLFKVLNSSIDIRPILVYVPGMVLFGDLLDKLPKISLRAILSVAALILLIFGGINYYVYDNHQTRLEPIKAHTAGLKDELSSKKQSYQSLIKAEHRIDEGLKKWEPLAKVQSSNYAMSFLVKTMEKQSLKEKEKLHKLRETRIIPALYQKRLRLQLEADPLLLKMGHFPEVSVSMQQRKFKDEGEEGKKGKGGKKGGQAKKQKSNNAFGKSKQLRPLSAHKKKPRIALLVDNSTLLRILLKKEMRKDLRANRMVIPIDLVKYGKGNLEKAIYQEVKTSLGYSKKREALFRHQGIQKQLEDGKATFYFLHLDTSGQLRYQLSRIQTLLTRFPRCKSILATYLQNRFKGIATHAKDFVRLKIEDYKFNTSKKFLRANTSYRFFRGIMNNSYLRWNMSKPLLLSLLINYDRWVGRAPRSLGVIYDRLLQNMLNHGKFSSSTKLRALGLLAYTGLKRRVKWQKKEHVLHALAKQLGIKMQKASHLLDELIHNDVLRFQPPERIEFLSKNFQYLCAARHLQKRSFLEKKHFLLRNHQSMISFYAGIQPQMSSLVRAWLNDYLKVDTILRQKNLHLKMVNPYIPSLKYAALAVNNGYVHHALVRKLETILFELVNHKRYPIFRNTVEWSLTHMSTPGIKKWILTGIENDAKNDHRLFRLVGLSPSDIYVGAIQRWLKRVRTAKDKQTKRHAFPQPKSASNLLAGRKPKAGRKIYARTRRPSRFRRGKRGRFVRGRRPIRNPRRIVRPTPRAGIANKKRKPKYSKSRTRMSVFHALRVLLKLGNEDGIQTIIQHARTKSDPRFNQRSWNFVRLASLYLLMTPEHFPKVKGLVQKLVHEDPFRYGFLAKKLDKINTPEAAQLVSSLIQKEGLTQWARQYLKKKKPRYRSRRKRKITSYRLKSTVRRYIYLKNSLSQTLARFDKDISLPILKKMMQKKPANLHADNRVFAALALGRIGDPSHFGWVKSLAKEHLTWIQKRAPKPKSKTKKRRKYNKNAKAKLAIDVFDRRFARYLNSAVASFRSAESFALVKQLYTDKTWRKFCGSMYYYLSYAKIPEAENFIEKQILCSQDKSMRYRKSSLLRQLGRFKSPTARAKINQMMQIAQGRDNTHYIKNACGDIKFSFKKFRRYISLYSYIYALRSFHEPADLPRFAHWAQHSNSSIRYAALYGLASYKHPAASFALQETMQKLPKMKSSIISMLGRQRLSANEAPLLKELALLSQKPIRRPSPRLKGQKAREARRLYYKLSRELRYTVGALGNTGGVRSLLQLYPLQAQSSLYWNSTRAIFRIAKRIKGRRWNQTNFFNTLKKLKPEKL